jgi:hypothetical protein
MTEFIQKAFIFVELLQKSGFEIFGFILSKKGISMCLWQQIFQPSG